MNNPILILICLAWYVALFGGILFFVAIYKEWVEK